VGGSRKGVPGAGPTIAGFKRRKIQRCQQRVAIPTIGRTSTFGMKTYAAVETADGRCGSPNAGCRLGSIRPILLKNSPSFSAF
jgi:hypothetical protein